jgi:hypothetical protein
MKIKLDKIASVTKNALLPQEVEITSEFETANGLLLAVEVLEDKTIYNQLELASGRFSILKKGDIVAVALGNRKALKGFIGEMPKNLQVGDNIHILNLGGVSGICTSANLKEVGKPLPVKVLGAITDGQKPISTYDFKKFDLKQSLESDRPLIVVSGTCMNVGKTTAACEILKASNQAGIKVLAAKLAGVAAMKDTENMKDYGAIESVSFLDAGLTSTVQDDDQLSLQATKGAIDYLSKQDSDFILIEFGDGVYGEYGVMEILSDPQIQKNIVAHIGCAHDPMGAMKLAEVCKEIGASLHLISGPVTDNQVGIDFIQNKIGIPAFNSFSSAGDLFNYINSTCLKK